MLGNEYNNNHRERTKASEKYKKSEETTMKKAIMVKVAYWFAGAEDYDFEVALIRKELLPHYQKSQIFDRVEVKGYVQFGGATLPKGEYLLARW